MIVVEHIAAVGAEVLERSVVAAEREGEIVVDACASETHAQAQLPILRHVMFCPDAGEPSLILDGAAPRLLIDIRRGQDGRESGPAQKLKSGNGELGSPLIFDVARNSPT